MASVKPGSKKHKKKALPTKLDEAQKEKLLYSASVKKIFTLAGFQHVKSDGIEFKYQILDNGINKERVGEIDNIFVYKNILIICEETVSKQDNVWAHLSKKNALYEMIYSNTSSFIEFISDLFKLNILDNYPLDKCKIFVLYCSKNGIEDSYKSLVNRNVSFLEKSAFYYFLELTNIIKKSAKYEIFKFFKLGFNDVGKAVIRPSKSNSIYTAFVLPETASSFNKGYKILTFYIDPKALIKRAFVLRRSGWENINVSYQRPLLQKKVTKMREHLESNKGVFVNNIIATLPSNTTFVPVDNNRMQTIEPSRLNTTEPVMITLPNDFNSICIIDGQHRLFSYHEGNDLFEAKIKKLREIQNLLVTAIYYPDSVSDLEKINFEARLFVDINSTQTNAKSELIQEIKMIIEPFSKDAVAREIIQELNSMNALKDLVAVHPYETNKLKPTTIVSYGLVPLVKFSGSDSLFHMWNGSNKEKMVLEKDFSSLKEYRVFAATEIDKFISAFKQVINVKQRRNKWKFGIENSVITVMVINGLFNCLRLLIQNGKAGDRNYYLSRFDANGGEGVEEFVFSNYGGSKWSALGKELYSRYFN